MSRRKLNELFEKFMVAVDVLATTPAPIQKRLEGAYKSFVDVQSENFDDTEMQVNLNKFALGYREANTDRPILSLRAAGKCPIRRLQK